MPRRLIFGSWIIAACLVACGPSAKLDPSLGGGKDDNGQRQNKNCEGDYNPISLFAPGLLPIDNPNSIPPGTYESRGVEIYARDQLSPGSAVQVHFNEIRIGDSILLQSVCQGGPKPDLAVEYAFPALQSLVVTAQGKTRVDYTYLIQGQNGRFTAGRVNGTAPDPTGMVGLLAKFTQARLYQTGPTSYELRGEIREMRPTGFASRWVLQRFALVTPVE